MLLQRGPRVPCQSLNLCLSWCGVVVVMVGLLVELVRPWATHLHRLANPSTSLLYTHCLTVPHWAAFRALPIISSRESVSASSSPSERRRGLLAFSGPMPRHNRWRAVLNFVPSALAAQPSRSLRATQCFSCRSFQASESGARVRSLKPWLADQPHSSDTSALRQACRQ